MIETNWRERFLGWLLNLIFGTVIATPLWFFVRGDGFNDAVVNGVITATLLSTLAAFGDTLTPGMRVARRVLGSRQSEQMFP